MTPGASLGSPARILLVDDRPENLAALEAVLEPLGQELVRAGSGEEALRHLLSDEYALILLDVQMPGMDGFETARHIKGRAKTRHIPIIFITAISGERQHALRGYEAGAVDYLFKPFDPMVLRSKVSVFLDLHRLRREAEELAHRALHDSLTGLPNRVLFMDHVELALAGLRRRAAAPAVLFLDLDGFKQINDTRGHEVGDVALVAVAARLRAAVRPADTVARLGGDEFTVLCPALAARSDAIEIAERIATEVALPIGVPGAASVRLGASIGIAFAADPDERPETLLRQADSAMYVAKGTPGLSWCVHEASGLELTAGSPG